MRGMSSGADVYENDTNVTGATGDPGSASNGTSRSFNQRLKVEPRYKHVKNPLYFLFLLSLFWWLLRGLLTADLIIMLLSYY